MHLVRTQAIAISLQVLGWLVIQIRQVALAFKVNTVKEPNKPNIKTV